MKTIMIIEDNPMIHDKLIEILSMENYHTLHASNGLIALDMIKKELPDLIITDVVMPGIDGFQLISRLKNRIETNRIPIVVLSAKIGDKYQLKAKNVGAFEFLTKPVSVDKLLETIDAAFKSCSVVNNAV